MSTATIEKKMAAFKLKDPAPKVSQPKRKLTGKLPLTAPKTVRTTRKGVHIKPQTERKSNSKAIPEAVPGSHKNPTIFGILMTRQLARNYVQRFRRERQHLVVKPQLPPTCQLGPAKQFNIKEAEPLIQHVVDMRMRTFRYHPTTAALLSKILATECKDAIKTLNLDRYKIVCQVFIGEKKEQALAVSSQCAWDTTTDNTVTYHWQSASNYCTVIAHVVYHE